MSFYKCSRRRLLKDLLAASALPMLPISFAQETPANPSDRFSAVKSSLRLSDSWESLNPGYWKIDRGFLRRALTAVGDRARDTGFPFHYESQINVEGKMSRVYDPSLPMSVLWNRTWRLSDSFSLRLEAVVKSLTAVQRPQDDRNWAMYQPGYGLIGIAFGGKTQFEGFYPSGHASPVFLIKENGNFGLMRYTATDPQPVTDETVGELKPLAQGDVVILSLSVTAGQVVSSLQVNRDRPHSLQWQTDPETCDGYFGVAARGLLDVVVHEIAVGPRANQVLHAPVNECHVCYPLGDTLRKTSSGWRVRFIALFRSPGEEAQIRIADSPSPGSGWVEVSIAGQAGIISNGFRVNTAVIDALLPMNPADKTLYYTVWKDGKDVTFDPRIGTDSVGPGTGLVGDVPDNGEYVGRLPRLKAPYKICGLSCHAIHTAARAELPGAQGGTCVREYITGITPGECGISQPFYVHDQPCHGAFKHLEDYDFQVMLWEDDVWYMELLLYPPSTEDAYKIVTTTIAGPTSRWQMMRHWNVLNPGDHDHGMDDVKGPEQFLLRNRKGLGQDSDYMVRNFQIVSHLMTGRENPSGKDNPRRWRKWKMPDRDFTLLIMDSRLWRTSQDPAIWDDEGWGHDKELYSRKDPARVLLGEEQFAWLSQELKTDSSPLICLTGINALHTIWGGHDGKDWLDHIVDRDRVSADYAGWVKAGVDRILDLISARGGVISVYGDVHAGSIIRNTDKRIYECSFGPIGRWGGRSLVKGFGHNMKDHDGRSVECFALYHHKYQNPELEQQRSINYWNFLEMTFDTRQADPEIELVLRNITDSPDAVARGGKAVITRAGDTGQQPTAFIDPNLTLPDADLLFLTRNGEPLRGGRSLADGSVPIRALSGIEPGTEIVLLATGESDSDSQIVRTQELDR